jgi:small subunit ribosomal protein S1
MTEWLKIFLLTIPAQELLSPRITNQKGSNRRIQVIFAIPLWQSRKKNNLMTENETLTPNTASTAPASPMTDFDWSTGSGSGKYSNYSSEERIRMESMYSVSLNQVQSNDLVKAVVAGISERDVILNIGFKSDGMVARSEFRDMPNLAVGDEVEVLIINREDVNGHLLLSRKAARIMNAWERIVKSHEEDLVIQGKVKARTKGGLVVEIDGIETFLPGSQIDVKPVRDYDQYVGKSMEFKVVKINPVLRNAVVSHKVLIESDIEAQKAVIMSRMEKGQVLEGTIKNMTDFGVFVDLGGVDGLLHITDMSWGRVSHPSEIVKLDDKVQVVVIDFDDERKRISLGMKQLTPHPWEAATSSLESGFIIEGKVVTVADYGAFLEIAPGVEGLVHVSEMSWSQHLRNPQDFIKQGETVKAVILSIDKEERKMSLGIKQLTPDPWITIREKFPVGTRLTGRVRNLTNFGLFVELGEGVDGLVHVSDLSWTKKINHPSEFVRKDQMLDVIVLDIDTEARRLSLGHKQIEENPWDTFSTIFFENSVHQGTLVSVDEKGGMAQFAYGVEAFIPKKQLQQADGMPLRLEDKADFKIIEFNKENRRIVASHARIWQEAKDKVRSGEEQELAKYQAKSKQDASMDSGIMGELSALSDLREQILAGEKKAARAAKDKLDGQPYVLAAEAAAPEAESVAPEVQAESSGQISGTEDDSETKPDRVSRKLNRGKS